jgi:hypothetical protein
MNKRNHIDLKPHIDSLCAYFGTTKEELKKPNNGKPQVVKRLIFCYLYYNLGVTYQRIANEFGVTHVNVSIMIQKANESLINKDPEHWKINDKLGLYNVNIFSNLNR